MLLIATLSIVPYCIHRLILLNGGQGPEAAGQIISTFGNLLSAGIMLSALSFYHFGHRQLCRDYKGF